MGEKTVTYALIAGALILFAFVLYSAFFSGSAAPAQTSPVQSGTASGCGDLTSNSNVQHLSHHPSQYAECIKQVDPAKFKEAVGVDKSEFMQKNGV